MDWGAIEADILHVQNLMKDSNFSESIQVLEKCIAALHNTATKTHTQESRTHTNVAKQCLLIHKAMALLYQENFSESLEVFEQVSARRVLVKTGELEGYSGVERVLELSREYLLHSYMNASVAAEKVEKPQLTQTYLERAIQLYREEQLVKHEAVTWHRLGMLLVKLSKHTQAGLSLNTAALLFKKREEYVLEGETMCDLAGVYWRAGKSGRVTETMERTHSICLGLTHKPEDQKNLYHRLLGLYTEQQAPHGVQLCAEQMKADSKARLEKTRAVMKRAQLMRRTHDWVRWERAVREARAECELAVGGCPKEASQILVGIAEGWYERAQYEETQDILERLIDQFRGSDTSALILAEMLERLGDVLMKQRKEKEAEERYKEGSLVLELKYDEYGDEMMGTKLQNVWKKYKSLLADREDTGTEKTGTFFSETASLRNSFTKPIDPEIHSLVTVSDLSEISCNDKPLPADSEVTRSLNTVTEAVVENITSKVNERRERYSRRNRTFFKNRISPVVSVNSQSNEGVWANRNITDNNKDTFHSSRCVIL